MSRIARMARRAWTSEPWFAYVTVFRYRHFDWLRPQYLFGPGLKASAIKNLSGIDYDGVSGAGAAGRIVPFITREPVVHQS